MQLILPGCRAHDPSCGDATTVKALSIGSPDALACADVTDQTRGSACDAAIEACDASARPHPTPASNARMIEPGVLAKNG